MSKNRALINSSKIAWFIGPGEDVIISANVDISLSDPPSFDFSGIACLVEETETM